MMVKYVAFLRGINVGGHKLIGMKDLSRMFEAMGFGDVRTYIQSGNVIFEDSSADAELVTERAETGLREALGYEVKVILRTMDEVEGLVAGNPFKGVEPDTNAKMYVTFLAEEPKSTPQLPFKSSEKGFEILQASKREVFSLSFPLPHGRYGDPVSYVEK